MRSIQYYVKVILTVAHRQPLKRYAQKNPHSMAKWSQASRTHVSHMHAGDFYNNEICMTMEKPCDIRIELKTEDETIVLKEKISLMAGEIIDSMFMSSKALCHFFEEQMEDAKQTGVLFSLHVKATMMKVSHPIVFGHAVKIFYKDLFTKYGELFEKLGVNPNNGISSVYEKIESLPSFFFRRNSTRHPCLLRRPSRSCDGRFNQRYL